VRESGLLRPPQRHRRGARDGLELHTGYGQAARPGQARSSGDLVAGLCGHRGG